MSCIKPLEYVVAFVEAFSPSSSEQDILDTLTMGLSEGMTAATQVEICCNCNKESNFKYSLSSVSTFLKYAEAVGLSEGASTTVFYDYQVTSGPIPQGALCQIIDYVSGDDFTGYVDNTKPTSGVLNTNGFQFYSNNIVNWFKGTKILYTIGVQEDVSISGCCIGFFGSVENFSGYTIGMGGAFSKNQRYDCCDFRKNIDSFSELVNSDVIYSMLDLGIIEVGDSGLNTVFDYISGGSPTFIIEFLEILFNKGVVPICLEDTTIITSVEAYLKYAEAVGLTQSSEVP